MYMMFKVFRFNEDLVVHFMVKIFRNNVSTSLPRWHRCTDIIPHPSCRAHAVFRNRRIGCTAVYRTMSSNRPWADGGPHAPPLLTFFGIFIYPWVCGLRKSMLTGKILGPNSQGTPMEFFDHTHFS